MYVLTTILYCVRISIRILNMQTCTVTHYCKVQLYLIHFIKGKLSGLQKHNLI